MSAVANGDCLCISLLDRETRDLDAVLAREVRADARAALLVRHDDTVGVATSAFALGDCVTRDEVLSLYLKSLGVPYSDWVLNRTLQDSNWDSNHRRHILSP